MCTDLSLAHDVDNLDSDLLVPDFQSIHFLHGESCLLRVLILNEGESLAHTSLGIPVDIHILDLPKGLEQFLELCLLHLGQLINQSTNEDLGLPAEGFLLLLDGVGWLYHPHLSTLAKVVLGCRCCSVLLCLRMLHPQSHEGTAFQLEGLVAHGQSFLDCIRSIELHISDSFASAAAGISDDADIPNFSTVGLAEEVPDVSLFGLKWQAVD